MSSSYSYLGDAYKTPIIRELAPPRTTTRVIGINDIRFIVTQNFCLDRHNVVYRSAQFQDILVKSGLVYGGFGDFEYQGKVEQLFEQHKAKLTDVTIEDHGYD